MRHVFCRAGVVAACLFLYASGCGSSDDGGQNPGGGGGGEGQGGATGQGGNGGGDSSLITPLSNSTVVYLRGSADGKSNQVIAFETSDSSERSLFNFEAYPPQSLVLSPDRKWILFGTETFRATDADLKAMPQKHIWKMSVDAKQFVRLSSIASPTDKTCADPIMQQNCILHRGDPVMTPDGQTVFFDRGVYFTDPNSGNIEGGQWVWMVPADGSGKESAAESWYLGCLFEGTPGINKAGTELIFEAGTKCTGVEMGFYRVALPYDANKKPSRLFSWTEAKSNGVLTETGASAVVWAPDGSGFLFACDTRDEAQNLVAAVCAYAFGPPAKVGPVVTLKDKIALDALAVSPDKPQIVISTRKVDVTPQTRDVVLIDLSTKKAVLGTSDGLSSMATW